MNINPFTDDFIANLLGVWSTEFNVYSIMFRLVLVIIFASIIGWERSSKRHSAGLRTFIIVSMACTVSAMIESCIMSVSESNIPIISAASVVSVAMLSGNSILFSSRSQIKGITTSAGLWACGIVGLAIGSGLYTIGIVSFIALIIIISQLPKAEAILKDRSNHFEIHLELKNSYNLQDFIATIRGLGIKIDDIESNPAYANSGLSVYSVSITISDTDLKRYKKHQDIIEALRSLDYIHYIEEMD